MPDPSPLTPKAPRQKRSEETLGRILNGARALLAEHDLDDIGVDQIAAAAGVSVGVLYTRFKSKDDLLAFLLSDLQERQIVDLRERLAPERWQGVDLAARFDWLADQLTASAKAYPGLVRAIFASLMSRRVTDATARNAQAIDLLSGWLLQCGGEIRAADPESAARVAVSWFSYSVHLAWLYPFAFPAMEAEVAIRELKAAVVARLTAES
jgi:AcrR family transcriptional regulator